MNKDDLLDQIELGEKFQKSGIMELKKEDFINSVIFEDRSVGFIGTGDEMRIFCIGQDKMDKTDMSYQSLLDDFPEATWRRQKVGDNLEIGPEENMDLIEKYESRKTKEKMKFGQNSKTNRSVKGLRNS